VESTRADHQEAAQELLVELLPYAGGARRFGISGVPGVGKSTFIGALGSTLTAAGHKVAVLAVDPSSSRSGGSILGDKTRMAAVATDDDAFIRPSPTAGTLGGVAKATRETMVVMEAAGYDVVIVETVGVAPQLEAALRMLRGERDRWRVPVLTCSAAERTGLDQVWDALVRHQDGLAASGELEAKRRRQQVDWTWQTVRDRLLARLREVLTGELTPALAADRILAAFME